MTYISPKKQGNGFEQIVKTMGKLTGWTVVKIPDGCKHVGKGKIVPVKSPFDFVLSKNGQSIFFDAKTYDQECVNTSQLNYRQLEILYALEFDAKEPAGYVIYFRPVNKVIFFPASILLTLKTDQSLHHSKGVDLGSIYSLDFYKMVMHCIARRGK